MSINDIESFIYSPPPGAINDLRYENLRSEGYYGSLNDMLYQKFRQKALNLVFDRLFINGEQGINKLDFSDFTGMYQDLARTVPYTAVEQPLGSFTGLNGVPAIAPADVNRGVVSARVNLLTKTEQFDDVAWGKSSGADVASVTPNTDTAPDGTLSADTLILSTSNTYIVSSGGSYPVTPGMKITLRIYTKSATRILVVGGASPAGTDIYTINSLGGGWYLQTVERTFTVTLTGNFQYLLAGGYAGPGSYVIWGASLTFSIDAHLPYQRVNTPTDYDTAGFPHYLAFDGTNTAYVTPSIDFTGTDKMTVWAGVTKLSDAAAGMLLESSANTNANSGSFYITAPESPGESSLAFKSRGSLNPSPVNLYGNAAPLSCVVVALGDIGGDIRTIRVAGASSTSAQDQGTGNYGNYPLYIGARAVTSLFFNGRLYSLIVRGAQSSLSQIEATETLIRQKMRLP